MAAPKGTKPPGGSRKGRPNKITADIKALAREHGAAAIKELLRIATAAENDSTRVAAIKELLDRGYGKATQPISGDDDGPPVLVELRRTIVRPGHSNR